MLLQRVHNRAGVRVEIGHRNDLLQGIAAIFPRVVVAEHAPGRLVGVQP